MNKSSIIKKMSISTIANFFEMLVSLVTTLMFPKILSEVDYSYWQVYVFYIGYVTIAGLGLTEGIYLFNGGKKFESLDDEKISFASRWISFLSSVIFSLIFLISYFLVSNQNLLTIILFVCIEGIVFNIKEYPQHLLLATDKIKEFSLGIVLDRIFFLIFLFAFFALGYFDLMFFMISDILGHLVCAIYFYYTCRDKLFKKPCSFFEGAKYVKECMKIGAYLLITNLIAAGIIGIIKYGVQVNWNIVEFGKVSLVITFVNLFVKLADSISKAIFPTLCNCDEETLKKIYDPINFIVDILLLSIIAFYYPMKILLTMYLPNYESSFIYMGYLLPMCLFQVKVSLIFNTYYKALRKEKTLMNINIMTFALSVLLTIIFAFVINNLLMCVTSILIVLAFRSFMLEVWLSNKMLGLKNRFSGIFGIFLSTLFVIFNGIIGGWKGAAAYLCVIIVVLIIKIKKIKKYLKMFFRKEKHLYI